LRLGKTLETLTAADQLHVGKTLIVSPKIATGVWKYEMEKWYGWKGTVITGDYTAAERASIRREFIKSNQQFMLINFAMLGETQTEIPCWNTVIVDEAHLGGLLNPDSHTFKLMCKLQYDNMFILTGTPVRKGPADLWPMLHLLDKKTFAAYWPFVYKHCHVINNGFGKEILGVPKYPKEFNAMLKKYMIRNLKKDVLTELPDKQRQPVPMGLEGLQAEAYAQLLKDMILEVGDEVIITQSRLTQDLRLRQLTVCPRLLGVDDDGVGLRALYEYLIPEQFAAKRAVVVGTPFRQAIPFIVEAFKKHLPGVKIEQIHGSMKESAQDVALRFQSIRSPEKILVYTIKSGASWTATDASTGFMLGYEWSTNDNLQAEDRIHRIGQKEKVFWNYLLCNNTMDEAVMHKLDDKSMSIGWVLDPDAMYERLEALKSKYINCPMKSNEK
jgi:SWI/SNF-related matrix-associated actin-dependent regulator 1 of chromatin subfamily A